MTSVCKIIASILRRIANKIDKPVPLKSVIKDPRYKGPVQYYCYNCKYYEPLVYQKVNMPDEDLCVGNCMKRKGTVLEKDVVYYDEIPCIYFERGGINESRKI